MVFEIKNKVGLVTGGASGIGLELVKTLLKRGAKGVTIADNNNEVGERVLKELSNEFGSNKIVFVSTDVSNSTSLENAFKVTVDTFKNIDILINNAGICCEPEWSKQIDINLKGTINGLILGLEKYLKEYKQDDEAVIVNTASTGALDNDPYVSMYSASKAGVTKATMCFGEELHYNTSKVRVFAICPGMTDTPMLLLRNTLRPQDKVMLQKLNDDDTWITQSPAFIAEETMKLIEAAPNGSIWVIENKMPAYQYIYPEKNSFKNNILK